jgi:hypothetical protein
VGPVAQIYERPQRSPSWFRVTGRIFAANIPIRQLPQLSMGDQAEVAFLRVYLNTLTSQPIVYKDDYQQPPENSLKKVPVLQVDVLLVEWPRL